GERAPFDYEPRVHRVSYRRINRCARADDTEIDEEPAVAVFGEGGEVTNSINANPRGFERLDERIGEPLRQIVEWYDSFTIVAGTHGRMPTGIADRTSMKHQGRGPNRGEAVEERRQQPRRGQWSLTRRRKEVVDQVARAPVFPPEQVRARGERVGEPAQERGALL